MVKCRLQLSCQESAGEYVASTRRILYLRCLQRVRRIVILDQSIGEFQERSDFIVSLEQHDHRIRRKLVDDAPRHVDVFVRRQALTDFFEFLLVHKQYVGTFVESVDRVGRRGSPYISRVEADVYRRVSLLDGGEDRQEMNRALVIQGRDKMDDARLRQVFDQIVATRL
jgi:hypothetical protein